MQYWIEQMAKLGCSNKVDALKSRGVKLPISDVDKTDVWLWDPGRHAIRRSPSCSRLVCRNCERQMEKEHKSLSYRSSDISDPQNKLDLPLDQLIHTLDFHLTPTDSHPRPLLVPRVCLESQLPTFPCSLLLPTDFILPPPKKRTLPQFPAFVLCFVSLPSNKERKAMCMSHNWCMWRTPCLPACLQHRCNGS